MKIFHHNDDDGRLAAAIINNELTVIFDMPSEDDFIEYNHSGFLPIPDEIKEGETVYIVDLALDTTILKLIEDLLKHNCEIIHIDHHKSTFDMYKILNDENKKMMDKVRRFYKNGISGCMLTWIYSCMNDDERKVCNEVDFDFSEGRTHVAFNYNTSSIREYRIPNVIRYVDDNDVWSHEIDESKYFCLAFQMEADKSPCNGDLWASLIYGNNERISSSYVIDGKKLWTYQTSINMKTLSNAFETVFEDFYPGKKCLCLNNPYGNSRVFEEKFNEYPLVCKFHYNGKIGKWKYSFYSSEKNPEAVDVSIIATAYGGGGHEHASGFISSNFIFK